MVTFRFGLHILIPMFVLHCATLADAQRQTIERYYEKAHRSFSQGDLAAAKEALVRLLTIRDDVPEAHDLLGVVYDRLGEGSQARVHFESALKLNPDFVQARSNLALFLISHGDLKGALTLATPKFPRAEIHFLAVTALRQKREFGKALSHSIWITENFPSFAKAYLYAATELQLRGELQKAATFYRKALDLLGARSGSALAAKFGLAEVLSKEGRYSEAVPLLEEVIRANSQDTEARLELSSICLRTKDFARGASLAREVLALAPQNRRAHFLLGSCLKRLGQDQEADKHLELFAELERRSNLPDVGQPAIYTKSRE